MGTLKLCSKSIAIVLAMVIGLTITPLKSYADITDNEQSHTSGTQNSTNTGLIIGGVAVAGLLLYFFLLHDQHHNAATATGEACSNFAKNYPIEKEHASQSILFEHESPVLLTAQADAR